MLVDVADGADVHDFFVITYAGARWQRSRHEYRDNVRQVESARGPAWHQARRRARRQSVMPHVGGVREQRAVAGFARR